MNITTNPEENYEKLRLLLSPKLTVPLPKNELVKKLITNIFTEEEAFLIGNGIKKGLRPTTIRRIRKRTGLPKKELKEKLKDMKGKGKIIKTGHFYILPGYLPGLFELYFTPARDDPERMKKAGEAHYALVESGFHVEHMKGDYPLTRIIAASKPVEQLIEIDKSLSVEHKVLPFEVLKKYLSKQKVFAVHPCSCRNAAELSGNPCKRTDENFCATVGLVAKHTLKEGVGKQVNLEELLEILRKAEKAGLVHHSINIQKSSAYICQCCPCCCAALKPIYELKDKSIIEVTNFIPQLDAELCKFCKTCIKKCPMEAISESDDNKIIIDLNNCIGCGVCAFNCPHDALKLKKNRNKKPIKGLLGIYRKLKKSGKK